MNASDGRARDLRRMLNIPRGPLTVGVVLLSGIACGDNPADPQEGLSLAEAQGLVEGLEASHAFDLGFDHNPWACPLGGTVSQALAFTIETASVITILANGSLTYTNCVVNSPMGYEFTLSGALSVSGELTTDPFGRVTGSQGTVAGDITWRLSGRSDDCPLNLSSASAESGIRVTGSACGHPIDRLIG